MAIFKNLLWSKNCRYYFTGNHYSFSQPVKERKLIKKWFFIRYSDPNPHIRLRFQLSDIQDDAKILEISDSDLKVLKSTR